MTKLSDVLAGQNNLVTDQDISLVATSGSYNDLVNKPVIPSVAGLASTTYVDTSINNLVNGAPAALDTLNEIATQLAADESATAAIVNTLGTKANTSSLSTVATSGSYTDLTNKPTLSAVASTGSYTDLTNKPSAESFLPTQTGNSGKFLTTNGTTSSWATQLPANTASFTAGGAITAGKAVMLNSNGTVTQSVISAVAYGTAAQFNGTNNVHSAYSIYHPPSGKFLVFYYDSTASSGKVVVATVSGSSAISYGTPVSVANVTAPGSANALSAAYDPNTQQILIAYKSSTGSVVGVRTVSISGNVPTVNTEYTFNSSVSKSAIDYDTTIGKAVIASWPSSTGSITITVLTISGTTITQTSTGTKSAGANNGYVSSLCHCLGAASGSGYSIHATAYNDGGLAYIVHVKIDTSTYAITFGTTLAPYDAAGANGYIIGSSALAWNYDFQTLLVLFEPGNLQLNYFTVSSTGYTRTGTTLLANDWAYSAPYDYFPAVATVGTGVLATAPSSTYYPRAFSTATFTGTGGSYSVTTLSSAGVSPWTIVAYDSAGANAFIGYAQPEPGPGYGLGVAPAQPDNRTKFIGYANSTVSSGQAVTVTMPGGVDTNQSGLTPGTTYYLSSTNGSTLSTTVSGPKVGRALSATSMYVLNSSMTTT